jgi:predicted MFS family arabinose efflux permease
MKYLATNIAIVGFGIALWNSRARSDRALSVLLILFAPINVIAFVNPSFAVARIFAMLGLLVVGAIVLARQK